MSEEKRPNDNTIRPDGFVLGALLFAGALLLFNAMERYSRVLILHLPKTFEEQLGPLAVKLLHQETLLHREQLESAVEVVLQTLQRALPAQSRHYRVHLLPSSQVNAFAYPGGVLVLTTSLVAQTQNPEELAGVLAHEIAHVELGHSLQALARKVTFLQCFQFLYYGGSGDTPPLPLLVPDLIALRYLPEEEVAATDFSERLLSQAGYPLRFQSDFFSRLQREEGELTEVQSFFEAHPRPLVEGPLEEAKARGESSPFRWDFSWEEIRRLTGLLPREDQEDFGRA